MDIVGGRIAGIKTLRGAPCGSTWEVAPRMVGLPLEVAPGRIGLETQYYCTADPSAWDPIGGKSPVHTAGKVHTTALERALKHARV